MHAITLTQLTALYPGRRIWWRFCQWSAAAMTLATIYVAGYFAARTMHRTPADDFQLSTGSRWTDRLFAPAIHLERVWLERTYPDAAQLVASALAEAQSSDRKVLLAIGTSSCLPCRQLERFLEEQQPTIARHFVVVKIEVDGGMLHGDAVQTRYRRLHGSLGDTWYFPWLSILDANGTLLVTSDDGPTGVIGVPQGGPRDRAWFLQLLRQTAPRITAEEIARLDAAAIAFHNSVNSAAR